MFLVWSSSAYGVVVGVDEALCLVPSGGRVAVTLVGPSMLVDMVLDRGEFLDMVGGGDDFRRVVDCGDYVFCFLFEGVWYFVRPHTPM